MAGSVAMFTDMNLWVQIRKTNWVSYSSRI